jgi:hypothetical protein
VSQQHKESQHPLVVVREAQRYVDKVRRRLELHEWQIEVQRDFGEDGVAAQNRAQQDIHFAVIRLGADWSSFEESYRRQTLVHEVLHVAMARIDRTVLDVRDVMPKKVWRLFERAYAAAVEPTVDRLALVIEPLIT